MDRVHKITLKVIVVAALIVFPVVYLSFPRPTAKATGLGKTEYVPQIIIQSNDGNNTVNDFCYQFNSKGAIAYGPRVSKPGLLKDLSEIVVATDSIFFLETSCSEDLNFRQCCAVESAARTNPERQIYVLFISPETSLGPDGGQNIQKLKSIYDNIHFHYVDIVKYSNGTKMEKWVADQTLMKSSFKVAHLSDGLRLLTLSKYGGIYFDLDIIVMHSLQNMSNFAGDESEEAICNAVLSMKRNGTLVNACIDEFVNNYRGDLWSHNGPHAIDRALKKTCKKKTRRMWKNCDGTFFVYPPIKFYPIHWEKWQIYFGKGDNNKIAQLESNSTTLHIWNKLSVNGIVKVGSSILYGEIASKYCPLSYWNSGKFF